MLDVDSSKFPTANKRGRTEAPLLFTDSPYTPLPEDADVREIPAREAKRQKPSEWTPYTHGNTAILVSSEGSTYKCPRPSCPYAHSSPQSVVIHWVRHCAAKKEPVPIGTPTLQQAVAVERESEDEII